MNGHRAKAIRSMVLGTMNLRQVKKRALSQMNNAMKAGILIRGYKDAKKRVIQNKKIAMKSLAIFSKKRHKGESLVKFKERRKLSNQRRRARDISNRALA